MNSDDPSTSVDHDVSTLEAVRSVPRRRKRHPFIPDTDQDAHRDLLRTGWDRRILHAAWMFFNSVIREVGRTRDEVRAPFVRQFEREGVVFKPREVAEYAAMRAGSAKRGRIASLAAKMSGYQERGARLLIAPIGHGVPSEGRSIPNDGHSVPEQGHTVPSSERSVPVKGEAASLPDGTERPLGFVVRIENLSQLRDVVYLLNHAASRLGEQHGVTGGDNPVPGRTEKQRRIIKNAPTAAEPTSEVETYSVTPISPSGSSRGASVVLEEDPSDLEPQEAAPPVPLPGAEESVSGERTHRIAGEGSDTENGASAERSTEANSSVTDAGGRDPAQKMTGPLVKAARGRLRMADGGGPDAKKLRRVSEEPAAQRWQAKHFHHWRRTNPGGSLDEAAKQYVEETWAPVTMESIQAQEAALTERMRAAEEEEPTQRARAELLALLGMKDWLAFEEAWSSSGGSVNGLRTSELLGFVQGGGFDGVPAREWVALLVVLMERSEECTGARAALAREAKAWRDELLDDRAAYAEPPDVGRLDVHSEQRQQSWPEAARLVLAGEHGDAKARVRALVPEPRRLTPEEAEERERARLEARAKRAAKRRRAEARSLEAQISGAATLMGFDDLGGLLAEVSGLAGFPVDPCALARSLTHERTAAAARDPQSRARRLSEIATELREAQK